MGIYGLTALKLGIAQVKVSGRQCFLPAGWRSGMATGLPRSWAPLLLGHAHGGCSGLHLSVSCPGDSQLLAAPSGAFFSLTFPTKPSVIGLRPTLSHALSEETSSKGRICKGSHPQGWIESKNVFPWGT